MLPKSGHGHDAETETTFTPGEIRGFSRLREQVSGQYLVMADLWICDLCRINHGFLAHDPLIKDQWTYRKCSGKLSESWTSSDLRSEQK
jgi:hypothetical protein